MFISSLGTTRSLQNYILIALFPLNVTRIFNCESNRENSTYASVKWNENLQILEKMSGKGQPYERHPCRIYTVNPLYNDIRYNNKIHYNVYSVCTYIFVDSPMLFFRETYVLDIC